MIRIDEQGRPEPPIAGDETASLLGSLERQRATLAWKCGELDAAGLTATVGVSSVTLGGLLKHMANVEDTHFARLLLGRGPGAPWDAVDWDAEPDWEWQSAAAGHPRAADGALAGRRGPLALGSCGGAGRTAARSSSAVTPPPAASHPTYGAS